MKKILFLVILNSIFLCRAETFMVSSQTEFDNALAQSQSGDIINWLNGTYSDIYMEIDVDGITVQAYTPGDVIFNGSSRTHIKADNVTFTGFQYVGGNILIDGSVAVMEQTVVTVDGSNTEISHLNFSQYSCFKYMRIRNTSQYTNVSYCNFENRVNYADQNIFQIDANETQPGFHTVRFCSFKNFTGDPVNATNGDDGVEPIRTGSSSQSLYSLRTIIEYCYFTGCNGDDEVISGKASDCIYRYNTLEANEGEIVLRHGNRGVVYGNFFLNGEAGVRVREGSDHIIFNNYFSGLTDKSIDLQASEGDVRVQNVVIAHNTFVDTQRVEFGDADELNDPLNTTFINNISEITGSSSYFKDIPDTNGNTVNFFNNIVFDSDNIFRDDEVVDIAITDAEIKTYSTAQFVVNTPGFYQLSESSTEAIDNSVDNADHFPFMPIEQVTYDNTNAMDILLSNRDTSNNMKDIGAQEYSATAIVQPHVTAENTGPSYFHEDPALDIVDFEELPTQKFSIYPNPAINDYINFSFNIEEESKVRVDVYDISGKKVSSLINTNFEAGNHTFSNQLNFEAGLYLLHIQLKTNNSITQSIEKILKN